jgi:hypothetical protein
MTKAVFKDKDYIVDLYSRCTDKEIAERLKCGLATVKRHVPLIYRGLGLNQRQVLDILINSVYEVGPHAFSLDFIYSLFREDDLDGNTTYKLKPYKIRTILNQLAEVGIAHVTIDDDDFITSIGLDMIAQEEGVRRRKDRKVRRLN